jgi:V8-like Glu-specific endopeptidase
MMTDEPAKLLQLGAPAPPAVHESLGGTPPPRQEDTKRPLALKLLTLPRDIYYSVFLPGGDQRVGVNSAKAPWSGLCYLEVTAADGHKWSGTGFLVGQGWVVTAAHVVWDAPTGDGGRAAVIKVYPARNGAAAPPIYGDYLLDPKYQSVADETHDVALIKLHVKAPPSSYVYTLSKVDDAVANRQDGDGFGIAGYPDDLGEPHPVIAYGPMLTVTPELLTYRTSTCSGESGGPITYTFASSRVVFGVHGQGAGGLSCLLPSGDRNQGVRVTDYMLGWIAQAEAQF